MNQFSPARRGVLIGIDGASMEIVKHFVSEGLLPNIEKLMRAGAHRGMWGVLPTLTPPGWTSIATGAWPGTHEVTDFNIYAPGKPLEETRWGINTSLCRAEYLWNTVERAGGVPILVKYEMSWPPTVKNGIQIEGTGPGVSNHHQIAGYHYFVARAEHTTRASHDAQEVDPSALIEESRDNPVALRPLAEDGEWKNCPASSREPKAAELAIMPLSRGRPTMLRGKKGLPKLYHALVYASAADAFNRVRITRSRNGSDAIADLGVGDWSDWIIDQFQIDGSDVEGNVRFKLVALSEDADDFKLFAPQIWPTSGYTYPSEVAAEILENVGPFLQNPARDALGVIDDDTYFEVLDYHLDSLADTALYLTSTRKWDMLFLETHAPDYANHFFLAHADPVSGAPPETQQRSYSGMARTYQAVDRIIGKLTSLLDGDTVLTIVSDHGGTPDRFPHVDVAPILEGAGLLAYAEDSTAGRKVIDWSKTKAAPVGVVNIYVNLKGREPNGIVDPADYEGVRRKIIETLNAYKEPQSGWCPFTLAVRREDAEALNLWGELIGDVVYAIMPEFDGAHGRHLPSSRLGIGGQHSVFLMAGAGVKKGIELKRQVRQVDVAPTLAYLLGLPVPRDAEGGVVYEALEDPDWMLHALGRREEA